MSLLDDIRESRMSRFQFLAVSIALALIVLDGFDIAVLAYAAPSLSQQWEVSPQVLGYLLSSSLFGMAVGALGLTPLGDRFGRRRLVTMSMVLVTVGMTLSALSPSITWLFLGRILTGLGIGAMSSLHAYVAEYSSNRRRGSVIGIYAAGYPIGATVAGFAASGLLPAFGWRAVFVTGAVLSLAMLAIAVVALPESLDYLLARRPADALQRVNGILARMGRAPLHFLPEPARTDEPSAPAGRSGILGGQLLLRSVLLWAGYGCLVASYYFAATWVPQLIFRASGDQALGVRMGLLLNIGGIVGCFLFSAMAIRFRGRHLLIGTLALAAVGYLAFGAYFQNVGAGVVIALLIGLLATAGVAGFYYLGPTAYPAESRSMGVGWMVGIGRLVSIIAPVAVGYLLSGGTSPEDLFMIFAAPLVVGAVTVVILGRVLGNAGTAGMTDLPSARTRPPAPAPVPAADGPKEAL